MKSFLKVFSLVTVFAAGTSAFAVSSVDCSPDLVIPKEASKSARLSIPEMIKNLSPGSPYEQFGDSVLIRDGMMSSRRMRYLHALKIVEFKRLAEEALIEVDPKYAKGPFVFELAGEKFYLLTTKQFKDFQNVTDEYMKSIAGIPLPDLPETPTPIAPITAARFKVPRLPQNEWTVKKKFEKYFAPQPSRLGPNKPFLILTWWNRPGWAVVDSAYLMEHGPVQIRNFIQTETQVTLTDTAFENLTAYAENSAIQGVLPSNKLNSLGNARMNEILMSQKILVTEDTASLHRLIIIPLMVQDAPKASVEVKITAPAPTPKPAPSAAPAPAPAQPKVEKLPAPAPVESWVSEIYAPNAPDIGKVHYNFIPALKPESFIKDFHEFERQLELNVPLALPSRTRHGLYELPFFFLAENHETKAAKMTFSFTRYHNGDVMLTVSDIAMMDDYAEKNFYQRFADFHRIEEKEFTLSRPIRVGSVSSNRVVIYRKIRSKLLLKHDLNLDEQDKIIEALGHVIRSSRGYRARVTYQGSVYSVYLEADEQGRVVVKTAYID